MSESARPISKTLRAQLRPGPEGRKKQSPEPRGTTAPGASVDSQNRDLKRWHQLETACSGATRHPGQTNREVQSAQDYEITLGINVPRTRDRGILPNGRSRPLVGSVC